MEISSDEAKLALDVVGDLRTKKTRTNSDRRKHVYKIDVYKYKREKWQNRHVRFFNSHNIRMMYDKNISLI